MNRQDFTLERGLKNFIYFDTSHTSTGTEHVGDMKTGNVLSIVWQGLKDHPMISVSDEQLRAVELYLKHMYHDGLDTEVDSWMFEYWHDKITKNNIEVVTPGGKLNVKFENAIPGYYNHVYLSGPATFVFEGRIELR